MTMAIFPPMRESACFWLEKQFPVQLFPVMLIADATFPMLRPAARFPPLPLQQDATDEP